MPLTTLDARPALVVIDLQRAVVALPSAHPVGPVVQRAAELAAAFRRHNLPVVLVTAAGRAPGRIDGGSTPSLSAMPPGAGELVDELDAQPSDHRVVKMRWGAFTDTELDDLLHAEGVTQVVIVGVATSRGVESTARSAHEAGYHVVLPVDAMTDLDPETHRNSVERIFPLLSETTTTAELLATLESLS